MRRLFFALLLLTPLSQAYASCDIAIQSAASLENQKWKKATLIQGSAAVIPLWSGSKTLNLTLKCTQGERPGLRFIAATPMTQSSNGVAAKNLGALTTPGRSQPLGAFRMTLQGQGKGDGNWEVGVAKRTWDNSGWTGPSSAPVALVLSQPGSQDDVALTENHTYNTPKSTTALLAIEAWFERTAIANLSGPTPVSGRVTVQLTYL